MSSLTKARSTKVSEEALTKLQRTACLYITSAYPTTPTAGLELLVGLTPLHLHIKGEAAMGFIRIKKHHADQRTHKGLFDRHYGHVNACGRTLSRVRTAQIPTDAKPLSWEEPRFYTRIAERELASKPPTHQQAIDVYTDGSKHTNGNTGAAAIIKTDGGWITKTLHLGKLATVFQAEVLAIQIAARFITQNHYQNQDIYINSDSQAALKALARNTTSLETVKECKASLNELCKANRVTIQWVPGHIGVEGNERADLEANRAASEVTLGPEPFLPITTSIIKADIKKRIELDHRLEWESREDCRQSKEAIGWPKGKLAQKLLRLSRSDLRSVIEILTGHNSLNRHRHVTGQLGDPTCPKCLMEPETAQHHIGECLYFRTEREQTLGKHTIRINEITENLNIKSLLRYLQSTGRLEEWKEETQQDSEHHTGQP